MHSPRNISPYPTRTCQLKRALNWSSSSWQPVGAVVVFLAAVLVPAQGCVDDI